MYYFLDIFVRDVSWYVYWEAILIGVLVATSLYFSQKQVGFSLSWNPDKCRLPFICSSLFVSFDSD